MDQPVVTTSEAITVSGAEMGDKNDNLPNDANVYDVSKAVVVGDFLIPENEVVGVEIKEDMESDENVTTSTTTSCESTQVTRLGVYSSASQERFVTQYIQEAQAGSQYQIALADNALPASGKDVEATETVSEPKKPPESKEEPVNEPIKEEVINGTLQDQQTEVEAAQLVVEEVKDNPRIDLQYIEQIIDDQVHTEKDTQPLDEDGQEVSIEDYIVTVSDEVKETADLEIPKETEVIELTAENLENYEILSEYDGKMMHVHNDERGQVVLIQYEDVVTEDANGDGNVEESPQSAIAPKVTSLNKKKPKPRYTRRVKTGDHVAVPPHVLGVDMQGPIDPLNGKRPRLGVKVPCKNLQSQIISKQDLQKEIMLRYKQKEGGTTFAKSLTTRLAQKLSAGVKMKVKEAAKQVKEAAKQVKEAAKPVKVKKDNDNSDLLAILEGNDSPVHEPPPPVVEPVKTAKDLKRDDSGENIKMLEREIAMQQLQEFPLWSPKLKQFPKGMPQKMKPNIQAGIARAAQVKKVAEAKETQIDLEPTETIVVPMGVVAQAKTNKILKTYSRKRKSTDSDSLSEILSPEKKAAVDIKVEKQSPAEIYVTKSSRIIKRKVIWDPDEAKPRLQQQPKGKFEIRSIKVLEKKPELPKKEECRPAAETSKKPVPDKLVMKKSPNQKKRLTEVDKLLMDEGAVNMLYDVKNTEDTVEKRKKAIVTGAKANKEMQKRANEIKNDLRQNSGAETPTKSLRKKESVLGSPTTNNKTPTPQDKQKKVTKEGKATQTPPASPGFAFESSRLIRRRSSSSISSASEVDGDDKEAKSNKTQKKKLKKTKDKEPLKEAKPKEDGKWKIEEEINVKAKSNEENKFGQYQSFTVKKTNKLVAIDLNYISAACHFSVDVLRELVQILKQLAKDKDCHVVTLTSSDKAFCLGLDYKSLVAETAEARKKKAQELSHAVRDYLKCLLTFPKVLVAGIQGDCVGLGVTMLPLFDLVLASNAANFSTNYLRLGCLAEAAFVLAPPFTDNRGLASKLFYTSSVLKADDALKLGLITDVCWPEKYEEELNALQNSVMHGSKQSLESIKKRLTAHLKEGEPAIALESNILIEHWMSDECQMNFAALN